MAMTDEQKYSAVLKELGEVLQDKSTTISCQRWQIDQLQEKLAAAEKEICVKVARDAVFREINAALLACVDLETGKIVNAEMLRALQQNIANALHMEKEEGGAA